MKSGWFGPKTYGIGAQPTGWQGWLTILVFVLGMAVTPLVPEGFRLLATGGVVILFLGVVALTYRATPPS